MKKEKTVSFPAFATLLGGCYRTTIIVLSTKNVQFTPLQCMMLPHSWLWRWSDFATSFMLLSLTVDRLLSVIFPLRYYIWGRKYSFLIMGVVSFRHFSITLKNSTPRILRNVAANKHLRILAPLLC